MDVARTSMIHAAAPHFLWPFAVQYAAHQLNLQPRVSVPKTSPTLRWTGKVGDASAFRVWGSRAFVRDLSTDKLSPRAVHCVFLGFPPNAPGWQFYHPTSRRVLSSQDVTFDESYAAHQLNLQPRVSVPKTSPTLRWTGKVGDASAFRVWGSRAFVRDLSTDKLSPRAVHCVFLGFPPDAPGWQFYHPTSRRVLSSQDVTFDESVPFYCLFPYRTAPLPPPPLFLAPDAVEPVEVAVDSGAARGTEPVGAGSGGAEPGGAESGGAEPGSAEPGGTGSGGAEPGGAESGGAESGGAEPGGAEPGGAESARVASRSAS
ncbi:unnamed protein product, partial [Closterium sp. NIES-54]